MELIEIYNIYYINIKRFILNLVRNPWATEDLVQETFLRIQENLPLLRDPDKVKPWIYRIAYNLSQDYFRELKKNPALDDELLDKTAAAEPTTVIRTMERHEMGVCVQEQLALLPEHFRTIIYLFDILDFSYKEISKILSINVANAKVRLHRARKELKKLLEEKCSFERDEKNILVCLPRTLPGGEIDRGGAGL